MQPSREANGQNSLPHACPFDISTRHPIASAYWTAASIGGFGCLGLLMIGSL
jgi:hypothetical protein